MSRPSRDVGVETAKQHRDKARVIETFNPWQGVSSTRADRQADEKPLEEQVSQVKNDLPWIPRPREHSHAHSRTAAPHISDVAQIDLFAMRLLPLRSKQELFYDNMDIEKYIME